MDAWMPNDARGILRDAEDHRIMMELLTAATPNGYKVSIMLEELGLPYAVRPIALGDMEQKQAWFLKLNPNGRIPVLIDHEQDDFVVFESGAILMYLARKTGRFLPQDPRGHSRVLQWLMFQMAGIGPMQGQANVFHRYAPERIPYAVARYQKETRRLYEVLDGRLACTEYIAGDDVSIADFATFPWARGCAWAGVSVEGLDNLARWLGIMGARAGVRKGMMIPRPPGHRSAVEERDDIRRVRRMLT